MNLGLSRKLQFTFSVFFHTAILGNSPVNRYRATHYLICGFDPDNVQDSEMKKLTISTSVVTGYTTGSRAISESLTGRYLSLPLDQQCEHVRMVALLQPSTSVNALVELLNSDALTLPATEVDRLNSIARNETSETFITEALTLSIKHRFVQTLTSEERKILSSIKTRVMDVNSSRENEDSTIIDVATPSAGSIESQDSASDDYSPLEQEIISSDLEKALAEIRDINRNSELVLRERNAKIEAAHQTLADKKEATRQIELRLRGLKAQQDAIQNELARKDVLLQQLRFSELDLQALHEKIAAASNHERELKEAFVASIHSSNSRGDTKLAPTSENVPDIHSSYTLHELFYDEDREAYRSNYIRLQEIRGGRVGYALTDEEVRASTDLFRRSKKNYLIDFSGTLAGLTDTILRHTEQKQCLQVVLICFVNSDRDISRMKRALTNVVKYALTDEGNLFLSWGCNDSIASGEYVARVIISIQEPSGEELYVSKVVRKFPIQHLSPAKDYEGRVPDFLLPYRIPNNPADDETGAR